MFMSKAVSSNDWQSIFRPVPKCHLWKIANVCISLNEFPFIRYYLPPNHSPLGALKPHAATRPPPPSESSTRWRTNLARGADARAYESVESDHASKLLAFLVQKNLEEHKRANPDFAVRSFIWLADGIT